MVETNIALQKTMRFRALNFFQISIKTKFLKRKIWLKYVYYLRLYPKLFLPIVKLSNTVFVYVATSSL